MRCESRGEMHPIASPVTSPSTFAALAPSLWHDRVGPVRTSVLNSLRKNKFIASNQLKNSYIFRSCPLGKHVKFLFYQYSSRTYMPFDIIHSDLWTSPVLRSSGHPYYVLFVDDYSYFL